MEKVRVQFDLAKPMADAVDNIAQTSDLFSRAEVVRRALSIFSLLVRLVREGKHIEVVDSDGGRQELIILPEMTPTRPAKSDTKSA